MQILNVEAAGKDHPYNWPSGDTENYEQWIEYRTMTQEGPKMVRIGFGERSVYGQKRKRIVVWINDHPQAEFLGADDFDYSGDVLSEIKIPGEKGQRICRYKEESIPARYAGLPVVGLPTRVTGPGVHGAWAVVCNISDHKILCALAALRLKERKG